MTDVWSEYNAWNQAIVEVVFGEDAAYQPVFLDIEDDILIRMAQVRGLELDADEVERALFEAVRATLNIGVAHRTKAVFARHRERADKWRIRRKTTNPDLTEPPPIIAVLATFSRAAEHMSRDDNFTSAAYFPRLFQLLNIAENDRDRAESSFRRESEFFWGLLNQWLTEMGDERGMPTAESIGHRYVGIPLSQALLRDADRRSLETFFIDAHLEPGLVLSREDMVVYLKDWIAAGHGSATLKRLCNNANARDILAASLCQMLEVWSGGDEGTASDASAGGQRAFGGRGLVLTARFARRPLGGSRLVIQFAVRGITRPDAPPQRWIVESAEASEKPLVELVPVTERLLGPVNLEGVPTESLLSGQLRISNEETGITLERRSQAICILARSDEAGMFVEVERVRRDADHLILVNAAARRPNGTAPFDLESVLPEIARPGYVKEGSFPGLPEGWELYRGVIVDRTHSRPETLLECLKPAATSALVVLGGLRLPGRTARWHHGVALELRAVAEGASALSLTLTQLDGETATTKKEWTIEGSEASIKLDAMTWRLGTYRVEMKATDVAGKPLTKSSHTFSVCGSDDPRPMALGGVIAYGGADTTMPAELIGILRDSPETSTSPNAVRGAVCLRETLTRGESLNGEVPRVWWTLRPRAVFSVALVEPAAPDSCVLTGAHHEQIAPAPDGRRDRGECSKCGRVTMYKRHLRAKSLYKVDSNETSVSLPTLSPGVQRSDLPVWTLLDALTWMQGGSLADFAHAVRQFDDSALSVYEALTALETVGHIDVARNPSTFEPVHWQMAPRALAETSLGSWTLTGSWKLSALAKLAKMVGEREGVCAELKETWFSSKAISGLDVDVVQEIGRQVEAVVAPSAGRHLLGQLRPIQIAAGELSRSNARGVHDAEWFNPREVTWVDVRTISEPGGYRKRNGFSSQYLLRQRVDIDEVTMARTSAPIAKHASASVRPFIGYDADAQQVLVPLGAELPSLYGRALGLMSGRPPAQVEGKPLLAYRDVPIEDARTLLQLLTVGDQ